MDYTYQNAQRLGDRCYKEKTARKEDPFLPVLEDITSGVSSMPEQPLGLQEILLDMVVGTASDGRRQAFAANFMPLMEEDTEFAVKYQALIEAHQNEGIRDPVKVYEYLHRYYVVEGNKRVSVMKFFNVISVPAEVTRIIPAFSDEPGIRVYYEFLRFYRTVPVNFLVFSQPGDYEKLLALMGWSAEKSPKNREIQRLKSAYIRFQSTYRALGGEKLKGLTEGDAFLICLEIYGFEKMDNALPTEFRRDLESVWDEFVLRTKDGSVQLVTAAEEEKKPGLLEKLFVPERVLKTAFLYEETPETLSWTYGHELGRRRVESVFGEKIVTEVYEHVEEDSAEEKIREAVTGGADVIFITSSRFLNAGLKAAVTYPDVRILCCALNFPHRYLRTYYPRVYEAKFISGVIAGAMAGESGIGYVANCPTVANLLNLNAFAGGVKLTNPHAKVRLVWTDESGADPRVTFWNEGISLISGRDLLAPAKEFHREVGLYRYTPAHELEHLAAVKWYWGEIYKRLIDSIRSGNWEEIDKKSGHRALNYFWGFDAGAVGLDIRESVPEGVAYLARHLTAEVQKNELSPFYDLSDQTAEADPSARGLRILQGLKERGWLAENIEGHIPAAEALRPEARPLVKLQGPESLGASGA